MFTAVILIALYLAGGRATFWLLTKADFPKTMAWDCGREESYVHRHAYNGCKLSRDLRASRNRRAALAYFWPFVLPFAIAVLVGAAAVVGVHTVITKPITTPAERRERRLALERQVAKAEAEDEKARAIQEAAQVPDGPVVTGQVVSAKRWFRFSALEAEVIDGRIMYRHRDAGPRCCGECRGACRAELR